MCFLAATASRRRPRISIAQAKGSSLTPSASDGRRFRPPPRSKSSVGSSRLTACARSSPIAGVVNFRSNSSARHGITCAVSERIKSDIYRELLPLLNSGRIELLDDPRLANQLTNLERRTARSGKDSIDHPPGAHDDIANSVAGALLAATNVRGRIIITDEMLRMAATPTKYSRRHRPWSHGRPSRQQSMPVFFLNVLGGEPGSCSLLVKSGHRTMSALCPLYPRKRTLGSCL
jgi:hypothetical protein